MPVPIPTPALPEDIESGQAPAERAGVVIASQGGVLKIQSLQILRFIAAAVVVYYHTHVAPSFGGFGVDIFFVLSGFIIAMLLEGARSPWSFAKGRLTRVVPLYWAITLMLFTVVVVRPTLFNSTHADYADLACSLFFIPCHPEPLLQVGWTLNYEMFFYACAALCLWRGWSTWVIVAGLAAAFGLGTWWHIDFFSTSRLLEFTLGIGVFKMRWRLPGWAAAAGITAGFTLLIGAELHDPSSTPFLRFGLPAALIVWSALSLEHFVGAWAKPLVTLGDASYALYLIHSFVVEGYRRVFGIEGIPAALLVVGIASGISVLVYWGVDQPLMRLARFSPRARAGSAWRSTVVRPPPEA